MNAFIRRKMIECMRRRAAYADLEIRCQRIAELVDLSDEEFLPRLRSLGHAREEVMLAHLTPLVQTAWADGRVSGRERTLVFNACRVLGITEGSASFRQLTEALDKRPTEEFFLKPLLLLNSIIKALPPEKRGSSRLDILSLCVSVAEASGGVIGYFGGESASHAELRTIKLIAEMLHGVKGTPSGSRQAAGASREPALRRRVA